TVVAEAGGGPFPPLRRLLRPLWGGGGLAILGAVLFFVFFPRLSWNVAARSGGAGLRPATTGLPDGLPLRRAGRVEVDVLRRGRVRGAARSRSRGGAPRRMLGGAGILYLRRRPVVGPVSSRGSHAAGEARASGSRNGSSGDLAPSGLRQPHPGGARHADPLLR